MGSTVYWLFLSVPLGGVVVDVRCRARLSVSLGGAVVDVH
jgi:hypothetical protein